MRVGSSFEFEIGDLVMVNMEEIGRRSILRHYTGLELEITDKMTKSGPPYDICLYRVNIDSESFVWFVGIRFTLLKHCKDLFEIGLEEFLI